MLRLKLRVALCYHDSSEVKGWVSQSSSRIRWYWMPASPGRPSSDPSPDRWSSGPGWGGSVDLLLEGKKVLELSRASASISLSELLDVVDTPKGREMFRAYLESEPFPHYEPHPTNPDLLVRIDADGTRTAGRFVDRVFTPNEAPRQGSAVRPARSRASGARSGAAGRSARRGRVA